jgi:hypothetical protein
MNKVARTRDNERGSAAVKFSIVLLVIVLVAHAGYNYLPVAYNAENLKSEMQTAVLQGIALPGRANPVENVKVRIQKAVQANNIPQDAVIDVKQAGNAITAHVTYNERVNMLPFGIYKYNYQFNETVTPTGFLIRELNSH